MHTYEESSCFAMSTHRENHTLVESICYFLCLSFLLSDRKYNEIQRVFEVELELPNTIKSCKRNN